jgi:hypothetical protein
MAPPHVEAAPPLMANDPPSAIHPKTDGED